MRRVGVARATRPYIGPVVVVPFPPAPVSPIRQSEFSAKRAICAGMMLIAAGVCAQEAFRVSLAGQDAAEAKKQALANQRFNLRLGQVSLRLQAGLTTEATDNVRYSASDEQEDVSFRPQVNTLAIWPVTPKNTLSLSLGLGYAKYINATEYDGLFVSPGSDLNFDLYVKHLVLNFHDRFSFSQDVTGDPTVSGIGGLDRFENTAGMDVTWDLNKLLLNGGYDHVVFTPTEDLYSNQRRASHLFNSSGALMLNPTTFAGLQMSGGLTDYDEDLYSDNQHIGAGAFLSIQPGEYTRLRVAAGYVIYFFEPSLSATNSENLDAFYADLSFNQRVNRVLTHSISVGRQLQAGYFSDSVELAYLRHGATWRLFRQTSVTTSLSYEYFRETRQQGEKGSRYGAGLGLVRPLTQKLTGSLRYLFYLKDSDVRTREYTQNRLVLDLIYRF